MNHVVFLSGGLGSWLTLQRVLEKQPKEDVFCLFTDTMIEDPDLYRFLVEVLEDLWGVESPMLRELARNVPKVSEGNDENRKNYLMKFGLQMMIEFPNLLWGNGGADVWDVFDEEQFLGNSQMAKCSHVLKQDVARDIVEGSFSPNDTVLYLGIDWTEAHRTKSPRRNWHPYRVEFPLLGEPLYNKVDAIKLLEEKGIEPPRLYEEGFAHNNCGGFCVRGGIGHFLHLLDKDPELYAYHESKEKEWREKHQKPHTILRSREGGVARPFTLEELRTSHEGFREPYEHDIGGCGCFVD